MEKQQDKVIRDRLNALDTLPEGYMPNLASKWSVLEAGLENKRKKPVIIWKYVAAAAMLLMIGGASLLLIRPAKPVADKVSDTNKTIVAPGISDNKTPQSIATTAVKKEIIRSQKKHRPAVKKAEQPQLVAIASVDTNNTITQPQEPLAVVPVKTKKPRFTEIDFDDNPTEKLSEPVMAAQKFRFKVNFGGSVSGTNNQEGLLRLRKTLN